MTTENPTKTQREPGGNPSLTQREPEHYSWEPLPADRGAVFKAFTKSDGCPNYSKIEHACAGMEAEEAGEFITKLQAYEILKPVSDECGVSDEEMGAIRTRLIEIEGWDCKNQPVDVDKAADAMNRAIEKLDGKPSKLLQMPGCPWPRDGEFKAAVNEFRVNDDCLESFGPKLADGDDLADTS